MRGSDFGQSTHFLFEVKKLKNKNALQEEIKVFKELCHPLILKILKCKKIAYPEYFKLIRMFENLGFTELSKAYENSLYKDKSEITKRIKNGISGDDLKIFTSGDCTVLNYEKVFIENIKSEGLRNLFYFNASFFTFDDTEGCTDIEYFANIIIK